MTINNESSIFICYSNTNKVQANSSNLQGAVGHTEHSRHSQGYHLPEQFGSGTSNTITNYEWVCTNLYPLQTYTAIKLAIADCEYNYGEYLHYYTSKGKLNAPWCLLHVSMSPPAHPCLAQPAALSASSKPTPRAPAT